MRDFVSLISTRAHAVVSDFAIVPQNAEPLLTIDGEAGGPVVETYVACIDGVGREDLSYGYTAGDVGTPRNVQRDVLSLLDLASSRGLAVLVIDYCVSAAHIAEALDLCADHGFAGFAASRRTLDTIPHDALQPFRRNGRPIGAPSDASNLLCLLNPERFADRRDLICALQSVDYDVLVIEPLVESGEPLTRTEVASLQKKPTGARRLVLAYLCIGEAEDYRPYWEAEWRARPPEWLLEENPDWPGNYLVRYWHSEWQRVVLDALTATLAAGFDGAYLDRVDAYESFEGSG
jgi:cysteinyl-tRNA synthetase